VDENRLSYRAEREVDGPDFIERRVGGVLNGFRCAGKDFEFLAYSQSALVGSAYMSYRYD
jgi:RNA-dependent RNA polymerase